MSEAPKSIDSDELLVSSKTRGAAGLLISVFQLLAPSSDAPGPPSSFAAPNDADHDMEV